MKERTNQEESGLKEKVIAVNRVAKVVKGGKRFGFTALVVVGDGAGQVGIGYGKAKEVALAVAKGVNAAKKKLITVPMKGTTIPYPLIGHKGSGYVIFKPAAPGTGVIAGGPVRAIMEALGIQDVLTKSLGNNNPHSLVNATMEAFKQIKLLTARLELRETIS
ncbi:MAG: 30S ribosomal protein S5 [bacterium]|nr:30S ribosomal protein S5 [bacterium]